MRGQRTVRVGDRIREVVSDLLVKKVKDPRVSFCTITHVNMTADLKGEGPGVALSHRPGEQAARFCGWARN